VSAVTGLPPRTATLVLCLPDGTLLGALPPLHVPFPFWQEAGLSWWPPARRTGWT